ncbi:hypothetical protein CPB83DRAFT_842566 [Crepidotus variabilis]|uniref:Uncharacterized protein n=1 Tax=Crepidotus variabilis TaxID=179855 RepID=A0A9P6JW17_9AGAR|nr:hypothetical protein CPB83DRAFT_842566 [Crepidotus variabilis]
MSISVMSLNRRTHFDDEDCPDYDAAVSSSGNSISNATPTSSYSSPFIDESGRAVSPLNVQRRQPRPLPRHERYIYTYRLLANGTPMQFMLSVEPQSGRPAPGKCTFRLSFKTNGIERPLCEPATRMLKVDPRQLDFVVFIFPGKSSIPVGSLWSLRVWLRVNGVDHRIFGDDELWVAKDPDFNSIADASFARMKSTEGNTQLYNAYVGKALVNFIVKWECISGNLYKYSFEYDANGVGDVLFDDFRLRLDNDPRSISFLIFSLPSNSIPVGAAHKLRIWIRSLIPVASTDPRSTYVLPFNDSYIYQRIWKTDSFKIGGRLDFESLGVKMIMGFSAGGPETVAMPSASAHAAMSLDLGSPARALYREKRPTYGFGD